MSGYDRRRFLQLAGGTSAGIALGAGGTLLVEREQEAARTVPFYGAHQAGIATPVQDRLVFASYDLVSESADDLRGLLAAWTDAAALLTQGLPVGPVAGAPLAPPADTGEALELEPSRLTLTFGFGESLFRDADGRDRIGLAHRRPALLRPLGPLPGETLDPDRSDGDLCVQACADDPQVAFHAVRNLARIGRGVVEPRWLQLGFGRTSTTRRDQRTPRNLQGFKDGTNNLKGDDEAALRRHVWVDDGAQPWLRGGTYLVARRIRMLIETWDRTSLDDQEQTIGRLKETGAPLGGSNERDPVPLDAKKADGSLLIPETAHIRLAAPETNGDARILRRGYSFTDGVDPRTGQLDAGLFFICFQRDPHRQFADVQRRLGSQDALTEYIQHTSSALFSIPPGASTSADLGHALFA